jgi:hypothetical protein
MLTDAELEYYYYGFYRVLRRYRTTSILGWIIVVLGCLSVPVGWNFGRPSGFIEVILSLLTILAGLTVIWQNISALEEYTRVPFSVPTTAEMSEEQGFAVVEMRNLMEEVDNGGWQEAYAAIAKLGELQVKYGLPKLE